MQVVHVNKVWFIYLLRVLKYLLKRVILELHHINNGNNQLLQFQWRILDGFDAWRKSSQPYFMELAIS